MAEWLRRWTHNPRVAGSKPVSVSLCSRCLKPIVATGYQSVGIQKLPLTTIIEPNSWPGKPAYTKHYNIGSSPAS